MKKLLIAATSFALFAFAKVAEDIIETLGTTEHTARSFILGNLAADFSSDGETIYKQESDGASLQTDRFRFPYVKNLKAIVTGDRVTAAKELCGYIRRYVNSEEFARDYNDKREKARPVTEPWRPDADQIESQRKAVNEMEKDFADMKKAKAPAVSIQAMERSISEQKALLTDWEDPHPYLTKWQQAYPEDPAVLVKRRLQEYLKTASTVDFSATLTEGKTKKFTNPVYETQTLQWKAIYRAGKNVNAVMTDFVKEWMTGAIITANKISMPEKTTESSGTNTAKDINESSTDNAPEAVNSQAPGKKMKKAGSLLKKLKNRID